MFGLIFKGLDALSYSDPHEQSFKKNNFLKK
jgi:hypothetical protein